MEMGGSHELIKKSLQLFFCYRKKKCVSTVLYCASGNYGYIYIYVVLSTIQQIMDIFFLPGVGTTTTTVCVFLTNYLIKTVVFVEELFLQEMI